MLIYVRAKLRDEDPFPSLTEELAASRETVAEPRAGARALTEPRLALDERAGA